MLIPLRLYTETYKLGYYRNSNVKGMGCQMKWYTCQQYSGVDPDSKERGRGVHRVEIGGSVYNSQSCL